MKNFFVNLISKLVVNLMVVAILMVAFVSLSSGQFPPKIQTFKDTWAKLISAKDSYAKLMTKSEDALKALNLNDGEVPNSLRNTGNETVVPAAAHPDTAMNNADIHYKLVQLQQQLTRIERQNEQILNSLNK